MSDRYVLDSYAVLAFLGKEQGHQRVYDLLKEAESGDAEVMMTWVNLGEVAYIVERRWGKARVYQVLGSLEDLDVKLVPAERELSLKAASLKAGHAISYADTFAGALAALRDAVFVTGDPEFKKLGGRISVEWLEEGE